MWVFHFHGQILNFIFEPNAPKSTSAKLRPGGFRRIEAQKLEMAGRALNAPKCRHCKVVHEGIVQWYEVDPRDPLPAVEGREGSWDHCPTHNLDWHRRRKAAVEALVTPVASGSVSSEDLARAGSPECAGVEQLLVAAEIGRNVLASRLLDHCTIEQLLEAAELGARARAADNLAKDGAQEEPGKKCFSNTGVVESLLRRRVLALG